MMTDCRLVCLFFCLLCWYNCCSEKMVDVPGMYQYDPQDYVIDDLYVETTPEKCIASSRNDTQTLVTLFTTMYLKASKRDILLNTLNIWSKLGSSTRVVLYIDEADCEPWMALFIRRFGWELRMVPKINRATNIPVLRYMFIDAIVNFKSTFYMYANSDILFDQSLTKTLTAMEPYLEEREDMFLVGRRLNYNVTEGELFNDINEISHASTKAELDHEAAIDYFVTTANGYPWRRVPDFVVGRVRFDSWLISNAIISGLLTIDATNTVTALHQSGIEGSRESVTGIVKWKFLNRLMVRDAGVSTQFNRTTCAPYDTQWTMNQDVPMVELHHKTIIDCERAYQTLEVKKTLLQRDYDML